MKKPKILISKSKNTTAEYYIDAIEAAGGEAEGFYAPDGSGDYDGLLLAGGGDMAAEYFGEEMNGSNPPDLIRDEAEMKLCKKFTEGGKPIMGICRGHQVLNIYFGGTLVQHMPTAEYHTADGDIVHDTVTVKESIVDKLLGRTPTVNSYHHQSVKVPGDGLRVTQYAKVDGAIEALEHETLPIFSFQWHPERMCCRAKRNDTPDSLPIFEHFVSMCKKI